MTQLTESFGRGKVAETILSSQTVPFTLNVSKVPNNENQYITISPDTINEEIFFYTTKTWTVGEAWTLNITWRGYYPYGAASQHTNNYKEHDENSEFKIALNHIIIDNKADLDDATFTEFLRVPVFADTTARDAAITSPVEALIAYLSDINDFTSYKNGLWVNWLGWGTSAIYYQDSTWDGTLTWAVNNSNTAYVMSHAPASSTAVTVVYNWIVQEMWGSDDYTITWTTITFNTAPVSGKVVAIYPDTPVGSGNSQTREIPDASAVNWELYRSTDDASDLYYKDNAWTTIQIHDAATARLAIPSATTTVEWVVEMCTDAEATTATDETRYINSKQAKDNYWINNIIAWSSTSYTTETTATITIAMWTSNFNHVRLWIMVSQDYSASPNHMWLWLYWDFILGASWINCNPIMRATLTGQLSDYSISDIVDWSLSTSLITSTVSQTQSSVTSTITDVYKDWSDLKVIVTFNNTGRDTGTNVGISWITIIN